MGRARYCFVPSLWEEPFGAVALEALAAGAIVVVADRGGLSEAVGPHGLLYDPFDEASLDQALRKAREKADLIRQSDTEAEKYRQDVSAWVDQFTPAEVTGKIISALTPALH
jgi:glycosyltransferase involved in cell wall biosynthesis